MSDATENGAQATQQPGAQKNRQVVIHAQYIKDLSFENPNAVAALTNPGQPIPRQRKIKFSLWI